ncbi:MAG TPA: FKBP-type peptidyl-prolyl cis-trans isomerase [Candidatus Bathyarchaeia archaeon]|nr:FKBP-type peptidyl-prolyl cis-trans isomerase [Candidatus Bathyarchaeia archaeon]
MAVKPGDFLLVNYTLKVKESGETVDTTSDSVAKESHIHRDDSTFVPKFIILGEGWLPKGLEESLVGLDAGTSKIVELSPEKGYGTRDPGKMRLVPIRRFREKSGMDPNPGLQAELDGRPVVVRSVGAGRVQVDYNHPLAGRTLVYDVSIDKVLENANEKILNLISLRIPEVQKEKFVLKKDQNDLTIEVPEEAFYLKGLQVAKKEVTSDLQKFFPDIDTVAFQEVFKRSEPKPELPAPTTRQAEIAPEKEEKAEAEPESAPKKPKALAKKKGTAAKKPPPSTSRKRPKMGSENQR